MTDDNDYRKSRDTTLPQGAPRPTLPGGGTVGLYIPTEPPVDAIRPWLAAVLAHTDTGRNGGHIAARQIARAATGRDLARPMHLFRDVDMSPWPDGGSGALASLRGAGFISGDDRAFVIVPVIE